MRTHTGRSLLALAVIAFGFALAANAEDGTAFANAQKIRPVGSAVADDLESIYAESGKTILSPTFPLPDAEIRGLLDRIDPAGLSEAGRAAYDRILAALNEKPKFSSGSLGFTAGAALNLEGNWRSDDDIPWIDGYSKRAPLVSVPLEFWFGNSVYGFSDFAAKEDPNAVNYGFSGSTGVNAMDMVAHPLVFDMNFPFRTLMSAGGDYWTVTIARDKLSMGGAGDDNLTISSNAEFYDFARFSLFTPSFKYSGLVAELNVNRYLYLHRLDFSLFDRVSIGLTEGTLVGHAPLELRYFNPLMVFHGYLPWDDYDANGDGSNDFQKGTGSELGIEVNASPWRYTDLFFQFQMNEIEDPFKLIFWPNAVSDIPNGYGALAGAKVRYPLGTGFLRVSGLVVYTTPYDYILAGTTASTDPANLNSNISYLYDRPLHSNMSGDKYSAQWIGFEYGPDTVLWKGSVGYDFFRGPLVSLDGALRFSGENGIDSVNNRSAEDSAKKTPSGIVETSLVFGASATWSPKPWLSIGSGLHWTGRWNAGNVRNAKDNSWELALSCGLKI
jgi:hypothetical protein